MIYYIRRFTFIFYIFIFLSTLLYSQFNINAVSSRDVKISFNIETNDSNLIIVKANIPKGYYAYLESEIANKIKFYTDAGEINTTYPEGTKYHNDIIIKGSQEFILNDISLNDINFIRVDYQLCNEINNTCLNPQVEILFGDDEKGLAFDTSSTISSTSKTSNSIENYIKANNNIFITLLLILLAGLGSILLPCTYPLLSITVSILGTTTDKDNNKKKSVLASLLFCLGIVTTYTILGSIVSIAGFVFHKTILFGSIGYNPFILAILVLLFLYFTFSLAGFYEIKTPEFLQSAKSGVYAKKNASIFNKYLMGLLTGIVATPCAAPIIAVILEIGFLNPAYATLYMATYAIGFSSVLFILGTFASILTKMPKAGSWMVYVKYVFTFLMLLISFYYANILFGVIGFSKISYIFASITILIFALVVYLIKRKEIFFDVLEKRIFISVLIISIILSSSYGYIKSSHSSHNNISFEEALEVAKKEDKPILIDFFAVWCANCYELRDKVFTVDELKKTIDDNFIFIEVDVDKRKDIANLFDVKWLPWIIVIDKDKNILYTKNSFDSFDSKTALNIKNDIEKIIN